ncbi:TPA: hypothetical protein N3A49_004686 [Salmonella enterica subsp. salamae serovar 56:l,v:z39]|nr:hypothetical protein [Salmonella enterica subsp. salamae serovar 56:l,v:z39]
MITVPDNCHCWPVHSPCFPHCASDGIEDKHFQHATRESPAAGIDDHSWYLHTSMQAGLKRFHHPHAGLPPAHCCPGAIKGFLLVWFSWFLVPGGRRAFKSWDIIGSGEG